MSENKRRKIAKLTYSDCLSSLINSPNKLHERIYGILLLKRNKLTDYLNRRQISVNQLINLSTNFVSCSGEYTLYLTNDHFTQLLKKDDSDYPACCRLCVLFIFHEGKVKDLANIPSQ